MVGKCFKTFAAPGIRALSPDYPARKVRWAVLALLLIAFGSTAVAQDPSTNASVNHTTSVVTPVDSNSELINAVNKMDRVLSGESPPRDSQRDLLVTVGLLGGTFLLLLTVLFGYLRLEHATRGFYSGRLQMTACAAAVLILLVCYLLWSQVMFK